MLWLLVLTVALGSLVVSEVADRAPRTNADRVQALADAAREAGAHVFYCTADSRPGGLGRARTPLLDRIQQGPADAGTPVDTYAAIGWGGQYVIVIEEFDLVIAFAGANYGASDRQDQALEIVTTYLLPALTD